MYIMAIFSLAPSSQKKKSCLSELKTITSYPDISHFRDIQQKSTKPQDASPINGKALPFYFHVSFLTHSFLTAPLSHHSSRRNECASRQQAEDISGRRDSLLPRRQGRNPGLGQRVLPCTRQADLLPHCRPEVLLHGPQDSSPELQALATDLHHCVVGMYLHPIRGPRHLHRFLRCPDQPVTHRKDRHMQ